MRYSSNHCGSACLPTGFRAAVVALGLAAVHAKAGGQDIDFSRDIKPILVQSCHECHGPKRSEAGLRLDAARFALKGGDSGPAIKPGKIGESLLIERVADGDETVRMPQEKPPLTAAQISLLKKWVDAGAPWPAEAVAESEIARAAREHWAYQSLRLPAVPELPRQAAHSSIEASRGPLDHFIRAKLTEKQLRPSGAALRATLLRRLSFDLVGLPPTPHQSQAFADDPSPDAYERVVDRFLASPRFGERYARHWMDVVHFAETHGNDQDRPRPNAWPYRDYLVRSFNADTPYARFIEEQIAGDVLFPDNPWGIVATGFISAGPWDESSLRCIVDDTLDKKFAQYLDRDDMLTTTMATFTSATVHCARCHDHKFDPISQVDYYGLQAVFAGVDRANRAYDPDPNVHTARQGLLAQEKALDANTSRPEAVFDQVQTIERNCGRRILSPTDRRKDSPPTDGAAKTLAEAVASWEREIAMHGGKWTVLTPESISSTGGQTAAKQSDGSILFTGTRPEKDTYTITAKTRLRGVTAVQLEVLTDEALPRSGPGRAENGNFHLSEFRLEAAPATPSAAKQVVILQNPTADFNQQGWAISAAIDGKKETAWGVDPQEGKPHTAIFELREPVGRGGETMLTFTLEQAHGGGHLIGRPRLSVTSSAKPIRATPLSASVASILAVPADQRSDAERQVLARHVIRERIERLLGALPPAQLVFAAASDFVAEANHRPSGMPREVRLLRRGEIGRAADMATPRTLSCVPGLDGDLSPAIPRPNEEGQRRAALARWISDSKNVLTWRSIVNRVWHYHFGRGIVETPNDFGRMGAPPTHPELLDHLALRLLDRGGSLKDLHRLVVTSATYRQASEHDATASKLDSGNRFLWRANRQRLDAESIRDATLAISGKLDLAMGGPSVRHFIETPGVHVTPVVDYHSFDIDSAAACRRSVYRFLFRTLPDPFMESMDCADASQLTPTRTSSVTALQALSMLNNRFVIRQSEHFAARLASISPAVERQIQSAFELALGRQPSAKESTALASYAQKHGLPNACRLLLNSNEFMFVD